MLEVSGYNGVCKMCFVRTRLFNDIIADNRMVCFVVVVPNSRLVRGNVMTYCVGRKEGYFGWTGDRADLGSIPSKRSKAG